MRDTPRPFEVYRHFKGNSYQVLTMAQDAGDGRRLVVYQALYGDYRVYVRELGEFLSPVDQKKYPDANQRYRFERVAFEDTETAAQLKEVDTPVETAAQPKEVDTPAGAAAEQAVTGEDSVRGKAAGTPDEGRPLAKAPKEADIKTVTEEDDEPDLDPAVLEFLEADTYEQRLNILASVRHRITDEMLNTMSIAADVEVEPGPIGERYNSLRNALLTKDRFELKDRFERMRFL